MKLCLKQRGPETEMNVVGYAESAGKNMVRGWALSLDGKPCQFQLLIDGVEYAVATEWQERMDVAEKYGEAAKMCGFALTTSSLEVDLERLLKDTGNRLDVAVNGVKLQWLAGKDVAQNDDAPLAQMKPTLLGSYVDSMDLFTIKGWALRSDGNECELRASVNGHLLDCPIVRTGRDDVRNVYHLDASSAGFEIYLPGYIWEYMDASGVCDVAIDVDGEPIASGPVLLHLDDVSAWTARLAELEASEYTDYVGLIALEHVKYSGVHDSLPAQAKNFVAEFAVRMQLDDYLQLERKQVDGIDAQFDSVSAIMLRDAMLELNTLMRGNDGDIYPLIRKVYKQYALKGAAKEWYLNLAVQLTCATGEFNRLSELTDFRYLDALRTSQQPHQLALLIPVLVNNCEIEKATEVMRLVAKYIENSWLPSDCLAYAIKNLHRLELDGEVDIHEAERFRMAFVSVLDGFKAGWFTRLHDRTLVATMVSVLAETEFYTDYHKRDLTASAVRLYGLSPVFWQMMTETCLPVVEKEMGRALSAWNSIREFIEKRGSGLDLDLLMAFDALDYYKGVGNLEASMFMTEITLNILGSEGRGQTELYETVVNRQLSYEPVEGLRLAAHPAGSVGEGALGASVSASDMVKTIRGLGDYHKSAVYDMQVSVVHTLAAMKQTLAQDDYENMCVRAGALVEEVERKSALLGTWQGMFLGADMLLSAYQMSAAVGFRPASLLMNAVEMIRKAVNECGFGHCLPAPICAAVGRISLMNDDPGMKCFLGEIYNLLKVKYGNRYYRLFRGEFLSGGSEVSQSFPQDTLVVIDTCRENLALRGASIRDAWVKELKARGIPFLFVVGGGGNTVVNDVLELAVADTPEFKPVKMLDMYEWVIAHTQAQYVVKIGDSAFMDVERYFDSLSYRKYHYYGKIVRATQTKVDRQWHHRLVDSEWAKKSLDKSSLSASFVAGKFSCSLSRIAVLELLDAARTDRGKRLLAGTFSDDKLIGDLLAMNNITQSDEDFDVYSADAFVHELVPEEVPGNSFRPGRCTPCKVAYSPTVSDLGAMGEKRGSSEVWPKKIWPSYQKPSLKPNANQLELVTDRLSLQTLLNEELLVVSVVRNEMVMLPQFLEHYRGLGVRCFIFVDNNSDDGTREYLLSQPDTILYSADTEYRCSHYGVSWQQAVLSNHCLGKWVLLADADEFLVYENSESVPLAEYIREVESAGDNGVLLYMIDMYPYGDLADADFRQKSVFEVAPYFEKEALIELRFGGGMYSNSRNFVNGLRHRIAPSRINAYVSQKYALFKYYPWVRLCEGVHYAANLNAASSSGFFAHFKYHAGFKDKVELEVKRKQHFNGAEEYRKYAGMIAEMSGGFGSVEVSEKYIDSQSFVKMARRLGLG
jgi:hypothetical protein